MSNILGLNRFNIQIPDAGVVRIIGGATVTIYNTNTDGTSPVTTAGNVSVGAVKSTIYADRNKSVTKNNPIISDSQGLIEFYVDKLEVHLLVTTSNGVIYGVPWFPVSSFDSRTIATDFPTLQDAINATPVAGTLFVPAGSWIAPDANGFQITKSITIEGIGQFASDINSTWFRPFGDTAVGGAPNSTVFKVAAGVSNFRLRNCIIRPQVIPTSDGTGDGIWFDCIGSSCFFCKLDNVTIKDIGRHGINAVGDGTGFFDESELYSVRAESCRGDGFHFKFAADIAMFGCAAIANRGRGLYAEASGGLLFDDYRFNGNAIASVGGADPIVGEGQVYLVTTHRWSFVACDFEHFESNACKNAIVLNNCRGGSIINMATGNTSLVAGTVGIYAIDTNFGINVIGGTFNNVNFAIKVLPARGNVGWHVSPGACANSSGSANTPATYDIPQEASNGANPTGGNIEFPTIHDNLAAADLLGNFIAGIQLPRVHGVAAITNPKLKDGLLVFDELDGKLKIRTGGAWVVVGTQV